MPSTATDRLYGITTSVAVKAPVQISADYNVIMFGEQTITSSTFTGTRTVTTTKGMRVLLTNQTNPIDNGIWEAMPASWRRSPDFDGARDAVNGTLVFSIYGDCWQVEASDPVHIGYDPINFRSTYPFSHDGNLFQRSLRVPESFIPEMPPLAEMEGKLLAIAGGRPVGVLPQSGSATDVMIELAKSTGANRIGYQFNENSLTRTVKDRLDTSPIYLSNYCLPSKTIDNSVAIQKAIDDAIALKKPLIWDGIYYSAQTLVAVLPDTYDGTFNFTIEGYGKTNSVLFVPAGVIGIKLTSVAGQYADIVYAPSIKNLNIQCDDYDILNASAPDEENFTVGLYHNVGVGMAELVNVGCKGFDYGIKGENTLFLSRVVGCHQLQCYNGLYMSNRGTSNCIDQNYVYGSMGTAYRLTGIYSSFGSLACDRSEGDIYVLSYFGGSIGSLGYESYSKGTVGTVFRAGSSDVTIGGLYMQDLQGKVTSASKLIDASGSRVTVENWVIADSNSGSTPSDGLLGTGITNYNSRICIGTYNAPYKVRTGNPAWDTATTSAYTEINGARFANNWGRAYLGTLTPDVPKVTSGSNVVEPCIMWDFYGSPRYAGPTGNVNMSYGPVLKLGQWGVESRPDIHGVAGYVAVNAADNNIDLQVYPIPIVFRSATRPPNPVIGAIWINPGDNKIRHFAGTNWYDAMGTVAN